MSTVDAPISSEMISIVESRIGELRGKTFADLASLPEAETVKLTLSGKAVALTVYRMSQSPEELLLVVQALRDRLFGITTEIHVKGFIARSNDEKVEAPEEMLWDYA